MTEQKTTLPVPSPGDLRNEFLDMLNRDWLGPAGGEDEVLYEPSVRDRYLIGMLAPKFRAKPGDAQPDEEEESDPQDEPQDSFATGGADNEEGEAEPPVPDVGETAAFMPSSMGVTVALAEDADYIVAEIRYGRYERQTDENERRYWQRIPVKVVTVPIPVRAGLLETIYPERDRPIYVNGLCRKGMGGYALTLFLVNGQTELKKGKDSVWVFQPEIRLYGVNGAPIFAKRPLTRGLHDAEDRIMEMLYRKHPEFAVGHGVGVHAEPEANNPSRSRMVQTRALPYHEVSPVRARFIPGLVTDMQKLAETPLGEFGAALSPLTTTYAQWLEARAAEVTHPDALLSPYVEHGEANQQIERGQRALERIQAGIALLDSNPQATLAFQFANSAMALQRVRSNFAEQARRGRKPDINDLDIPENRTWYPFQLAFILLNMPAIVDPTHLDRSADNADAIADLLWFPTGGGKTEAYLGLTAFTLAIRRLQGDTIGFDGRGAGVAVIMRYTLRLLTLQQFQRATALICACEKLRRDAPSTWGTEPFRIGLWVGASSTPNYTEASAQAVAQAHGGGYFGGGTPVQLKHCPWCGSRIDPGKNIKVELFEEGAGRTLQYCSDVFGECPFGERRAKGEGLPIVVVDEEIYRRLPALLIATVDKFAQMPWKGATQMLFGRVNGHCPRHGYRSPELPDSDSHPKKGTHPACKTTWLEHGLRPPDLIIQDELHLISGPLGTLVGLYETAIDTLCEWTLNGATVRPKVVASTATIRRARYQVHSLFQRNVEVFPPSGLDADDNFFAQQDTNAPGRTYLGVCVSGTRLKSVLIRVYVTAMSAAQALYDKYGPAADPYMTLVGYFNSIRELGGMMRVMDDAVVSRLRRMAERGLAKRVVYINNVEELTSRKTATEIPDILDKLEVPFGGDKYPLDAVLATNMISVGVDVGRLGCMVVAGQPKATAEYIQATSRVGRRYPGVVVTVYNWTRPRDLSHFERFEHYHSTFYQQVEALSVTPFAPRAVDRALDGVFVSLMRLYDQHLNQDDAAGKLRGDDPLLDEVMARIVKRARLVTAEQYRADQVENRLKVRKDVWLSKTRSEAVQLTYATQRGPQIKLLSAPQEFTGERREFTCLNSMRDVEPPIRLILNDYGMDVTHE